MESKIIKKVNHKIKTLAILEAQGGVFFNGLKYCLVIASKKSRYKSNTVYGETLAEITVKMNHAIKVLDEAEAYKKEKRDARNAARKTARAEYLATLNPGDLFYTCWGYDQTNREFYQVIRVNAGSVTIREVAQDSEPAEFMAENVAPVKDQFIGAEMIKTIGGTENYPAIKVDGHALYKYEGGRLYTSHYA